MTQPGSPRALCPNGLAFGKNKEIYISNFGTDVLEVMDRDTGETNLLYDSIDGAPIGKVNFVLRDSKDRLWLTVSTRIKNWMEAMSPNVADGFVALARRERPSHRHRRARLYQRNPAWMRTRSISTSPRPRPGSGSPG